MLSAFSKKFSSFLGHLTFCYDNSEPFRTRGEIMPITSLSGSYSVSATDILTDHVLFRVYYPTNPTTQNASWFPRPWLYTKGYINFLKLPRFSSALLYPITKFLKGLYTLNARVFPDRQFPVILFSHGLGGMRTAYSFICAELASHGAIVAAVEHWDGSASIACTSDKPVQYDRIDDHQPEPGQTRDEFYLMYRRKQVAAKVTEITEAFKILQALNSGDMQGVNVYTQNENMDSSQEILASFKDRLDFSKCVMMGHSFGVSLVYSVNICLIE